MLKLSKFLHRNEFHVNLLGFKTWKVRTFFLAALLSGENEFYCVPLTHNNANSEDQLWHRRSKS